MGNLHSAGAVIQQEFVIGNERFAQFLAKQDRPEPSAVDHKLHCMRARPFQVQVADEAALVLIDRDNVIPHMVDAAFN